MNAFEFAATINLAIDFFSAVKAHQQRDNALRDIAISGLTAIANDARETAENGRLKFNKRVILRHREYCRYRHHHLYADDLSLYDGILTITQARYHGDILVEVELKNLPTEDLVTLLLACIENVE